MARVVARLCYEGARESGGLTRDLALNRTHQQWGGERCKYEKRGPMLLNLSTMAVGKETRQEVRE